jgi:hypothetical protein
MRPEIRRNRENKAKKLEGKYLDALKTATENESMNRMINSNPRGGMSSGRYTASKGGKIEMPLAKPN